MQASRLGEDGLKVVILYWHEVAIIAHQRDYSKRELGRANQSPSQPGPAYTSRALTITHVAMYDAVAGITGSGEGYIAHSPSPPEFKGVLITKKNVFLVFGEVLERIRGEMGPVSVTVSSSCVSAA